MKYALIHGERICQTVSTAKECFPVAPELKWVEVPDDAETEHAFIKGKVVKPAAPVKSPATELTPAQKLEALGITVADMKALLGIK